MTNVPIPPEASISKRIEIVLRDNAQTAVIVDGIDITHWIASDGFHGVDVKPNMEPRLSVTLTASEFSFRDERRQP